MTQPAPETLEREKLFITDAELIRRIGVPEKIAYPVLRELDSRPSGFPKKQKLWGDRRYWPAVKDYLDRTNGLQSGAGAARLAAESRDRTRLPRPHPAVLQRRSASNE